MFLTRCDDKTFKRLMSNFGSSRSEESCSAVLELLERVTRLHKQLQLKERQAEMDADQVQTATDFHFTRGGPPRYPLTCSAPSMHTELCTLHH